MEWRKNMSMADYLWEMCKKNMNAGLGYGTWLCAPSISTTSKEQPIIDVVEEQKHE